MYRAVWTRTRRLLRPYHQLATSKRNKDANLDVDRGALHPRERGDRFTEEAVYRNKSDVTLQVKSRQRERHLRSAAAQQRAMQHYQLDARHEAQLRSGQRLPRSANEMAAVRAIDAADVLAHDAPRVTAQVPPHEDNNHDNNHDDDDDDHDDDQHHNHHHNGASHAHARRRARHREHGSLGDATHDTRLHHQLLRRTVERREHMLDKYGQPPTASEFGKLFQHLRAMDDDDEVIEQHQRRLADENGVLSESRLDAYMLDDDSYFPAWVHALPSRVRDRVKYGALGLTEEDEVLRVRLGRLPRDRRLHEWQRLKRAKQYKAAHEETLTPTELRDARAGRRRFFWLQHRRQRRAALLRRLALRHPDRSEVWPSHVVDYSQRIAFIAQHVENGLQTHGQWPLDPAALQRAKAQRNRLAAERAFLQSSAQNDTAAAAAASSSSSSSSRMSGAIRDILSSFDERVKPLKYVSRKVYANRVNAVMHGDQDAYGHKHRRLLHAAAHRTAAHASLSEMAAEREVRHEPRVDVSGHVVDSDAMSWPRYTRKWAEGMPTQRSAS